MTQRVTTFQGSGTLKTWSEPSSLQAVISNALTSNGWGVVDLEIVNSRTLGQALLYGGITPTWQYQFVIGIDTQANDNPERIKQGLISVLWQWFDNVDLYLANDNTGTVNPATGQTDYLPTNNIVDTGNQSGVLDNIEKYIFGKDSSGIGHIAAISTGTILLIGGLVLAIAFAKQSPSNPMRYIRRR